MARPQRPTAAKATAAAKAADRLDREDNIRFVMEIAPNDRRALKVYASERDLTVKALLLGLAKQHGIPIEDPEAAKAAQALDR